MNIENQKTYILCENPDCSLHSKEIEIDMDQYIVITPQDVGHIAHYELPRFRCVECFWELVFYARKKDGNSK